MLKIISKKKYDSLQEVANTIKQLPSLFVLRSNSYPCDKCTIGNDKCRKLHFHNTTICVCKEEDICSFPPKRKKHSTH